MGLHGYGTGTIIRATYTPIELKLVYTCIYIILYIILYNYTSKLREIGMPMICMHMRMHHSHDQTLSNSDVNHVWTKQSRNRE